MFPPLLLSAVSAERDGSGVALPSVNYLHVFFSLLFVLLLVWLLYFFVSKFISPQRSHNAGDVRVIPLTFKHQIALFKYRGKEFLLGLSERNVQLLYVFDSDESEDFAKEVEKWIRKESSGQSQD